jgi:hypothetical protein
MRISPRQKLSFERAATILFPGATRSGLIKWSYFFTPPTVLKERVGPRELKVAILSSSRLSVPKVFVAPTMMTVGSLPGE